MGRRILAVIVFLFAATATVRPQETHGMIEGVVRDTQGAVVPGVVVLAGNGSGFKAEAVTDALGKYRFPALPPNQYELIATLADFVKARVPDALLTLGAQLTVDFVLEAAGPNVTVEVVSQAPTVEITQSASTTSIRGSEIDRMPRGRDFSSLALRSPGANAEPKLGGLSIDGASGAENRMIVDGVETTDTLIGVPGLPLSADFIDEIQVKSSGYAAEFGGSTGGVVNVVTRSGGELFRGRAIVYGSADALDAGLRPTLRLAIDDTRRVEYVVFPEDRYRDIATGFTVGGPALPGRLWLFGGYLPSVRSIDRQTTFTVERITQPFHQRVTRPALTANATAHIGNRWRAKSAFNLASQARRGLLPAADGTGNPNADYSIDEITSSYSASTNVDVTLGTQVLVSGRVGYFFRNLYNEGIHRGDRIAYPTSSLGLADVPVEYQRPRGYANVPSNIGRERGKGPHFNAQMSATAFFRAGGDHQLKSGVQMDRLGIDSLVGNTGNVITVFWDQSFLGRRGPAGYYLISSNDRFPNLGVITEGKATVTNVGLFVQDTWTVGRRLTVHLGLRTESESVPSLSPDPRIPDVAIRFGFADKLAPRFGFSWDATGDGRTKIFGSWGLFYDITKLQLSTAFGAYSSVRYAYTLDGADIGRIVDNADCPPACPGVLIDRTLAGPPLNDPDDSHIDPGLRQTRLREGVVGLEREIARALTLTARYAHKRIDRAMEDVGTQRPQEAVTSVMIANPGFGKASLFYPGGAASALPLPAARRDYDAVEIGLDRRLSGRWSGSVSYAWSRLAGNYSGLAQSDENGRVAPNTGRTFDYPLMSFDERGQPVSGPLASDRPHRMKASALVDCGFGFSLGAQWFGMSGIPRTREAAFLPGHNVPVMYRGRNSDGRLPFLSQTDAHLLHRARLGNRLHLTFSATAINLLNQATPTDYFATELFEGQAVAVDESTFYAGVDTQALIASQRLVRDPRFLKDSGYQLPRTLRLGISLDF